MKITINHLFARFSALIFTVLVAFSSHAETSVIDEIAAIVNDEIILKSDLSKRVRTLKTQLTSDGVPLPDDERLTKDVLERMVLDSLQLQIAKKLNISISDDILNETIASMAQKNGISVQNFIQKLNSENINYSRFRSDLSAELLLQRVQQSQVSRRVSISPSDVERFKKAQSTNNDTQYQIAHILLEYGSDADEATRAAIKEKALQMRTDAATQDFAILAQQHSSASSAINGGDLGWRTAAELPSIFKAVTPSMNIGDISEPIETLSGVHIVKLINKISDDVPTTFITEHFTRHILLKTESLSESEKASRKVELEALRNQIINSNNNDRFTELAQKFSDDIGSGAQGGELGWAREGQMVTTFEDVMTSIKLNTVSPVFESQFGWHILEVTERKQTDVTSQVEDNKIRQQIYQQRYQEALQSWLRQLRSDAYVDIKLNS